MENATKALLIAAGVLIGVLIISLGVTLFSSLKEYVVLNQENMLSKKIQQFNQQFTRYINYNDETKEFVLTIHDIVTAANIARENNLSYELAEYTGPYDGNNYYVTVNIEGNHLQLEQSIKEKTAEILSKNLVTATGQTKEYKCSYEDVKINAETGRVYEITFHEMS